MRLTLWLLSFLSKVWPEMASLRTLAQIRVALFQLVVWPVRKSLTSTRLTQKWSKKWRSILKKPNLKTNLPTWQTLSLTSKTSMVSLTLLAVYTLSRKSTSQVIFMLRLKERLSEARWLLTEARQTSLTSGSNPKALRGRSYHEQANLALLRFVKRAVTIKRKFHTALT